MTIANWLREGLARRPLWMNAILAFCTYMTFIYLPWDVFIKPLEVDQEVWFGVLFTGWAAKAGALLHWFVYGAGTLTVAHAQLAATVDESVFAADCLWNGLLGTHRSARK